MGTLNLRKKNVVVVSLFDGLSGARLALEQVPHLNVLRYYSAESVVKGQSEKLKGLKK